MKNSYKAISLISIISLNACASIIEGSSQEVTVSTVPNSAASCMLDNGQDNTISISSSNSATVEKSKNSLNITCRDDQTGATGSKNVESDFAAWTVGSMLFGLIGVGIDAATGAWFKYPENIGVPMSAPLSAQPQYSAPVTQSVPAPAPTQYYAPQPTPTYLQQPPASMLQAPAQ